jgi:uncharacterized protein involved in type VI secretion and phage assembly
LVDHNKRRKVATGGRMMYARGESKTCDVRIGRLIDVTLPPNLSGTHVGTYRVYSIVHEFDQNGRYRCMFEAIPSDLEFIPTPNIHIPTPNLIQAEVWDNEDPEGMGRIKVEFPFDEKPCETWIPVMTPDAGGKGEGLGPASRGYSFLPELKDTVAISFLDGSQLCHPVIVGSMFHGKNAENLGGGPDNNIKTIRTRSGHLIHFDDSEKDTWGITISDRNGNFMNWDTKGKNITINTPETLTVNAKNMIFNAEEDVKWFIGRDLEENITETQTTSTKNKKIFVHEDMETMVENNQSTHVQKTLSSQAKNVEHRAEGGNYNINCNKTVEIKGTDEVKLT